MSLNAVIVGYVMDMFKNEFKNHERLILTPFY